MVDVARGFATLPTTRPQTLPRDASPPPQRPLDNSDDTSSFSPPTSTTISALDSSPPNPSSENAQASRKGAKRVGFSPWTEYHKAPVTSDKKAEEHRLKPLPPSRERRLRKNIRSILKPFDIPIVTKQLGVGSSFRFQTFPKMLESVLQLLAGDAKERSDAYSALSKALKAYEGVPDQRALSSKMGLLMQFMRRDMCAVTPETGTLDITLVLQSLKILTTFVWTPELSRFLSDDFRCFVLDRSLFVLEEIQMPKPVVLHHMNVLALQSFRPNIMSSQRANRLVTSLHDIDSRVSGNSVKVQRLVIYQRILHQVQDVMASRVADWIGHMFAGLRIGVQTIRARAIAFGIDAGLALGSIHTVSGALVDEFNHRSPDGRMVIDLFSDSLNSMVLSKEQGAYVPQIWSVPVLFMRGRQRRFERWEHFKTWLYIIQKCFNSGDFVVKSQANIAWNRLVFVINPDASIGPALMKMLRQPVGAQLVRNVGERQNNQQARQVVLGSYCNLLYYAFKPTASHLELDLFWLHYVDEVFTDGFLSSATDRNMACRILTTLLGDTRPRPWNECRGTEPGPVKPEELARVDPKWVRSRIMSILGVFERVFQAAKWLTEPNQDALVRSAWQSLMGAIAEAGTKEVKISSQCMTAVAHIYTMLKRLWEKESPPPGVAWSIEDEDLMTNFATLFDIAITHIGSLPFTDKCLLKHDRHQTRDDESPEPSTGWIMTPVMHMLQWFLRTQRNVKVTETSTEIIKGILQKAVNSRTSREGQLDLLLKWTWVLSEDTIATAGAVVIWTVIADLAISALTIEPSLDRISESPQYVGHEYRNVVKLLVMGLQLDGPEVCKTWEELCKGLVNVVRKETGDGGVILAVIEPLAHVAAQEDGQPSQVLALDHASLLLEKLSWPSSGIALNESRKALWGVESNTRITSHVDPLDHTYEMINSLLIASYKTLTTTEPDSIQRFLGALCAVLQRTPLSLVSTFLKRIQEGVSVWVRDKDQVPAHIRPMVSYTPS